MKRSFRSFSTAIALSLLAMLAALQTQAQTLSIDLPAQPLESSLRAISKLAQINVLFDPKVVEGLPAPALKGNWTGEEAVRKLAHGTGLQVQQPVPGTITVGKVNIKSSADTTSIHSALGVSQSNIGEADLRLARAEDKEAKEKKNNPERANESSESKETTEIVVTGSRLRGVHQGASPQFQYDREDFAEAGVTSVQQMLRVLPQNFSGGASEQAAVLSSTRNGNLQNTGAGAGINLRGLGNGATLVLLDGQRLAPGGTGAFVDVAAIPLSALERIEVVSDGASAIYGSDAVAGVVNLIVRRDLDGAQTSVRGGSVTSGSFTEFNASQVIGDTWNSGSGLITLEYNERSRLNAADRDFATGLSSRPGPTDLIPNEERYGALLTGKQVLSKNIGLQGTAYSNHRSVNGRAFDPLFLTQFSTDIDVEQLGGTLEIEWKVAPDWHLSAAQTLSHMETDRRSAYAATQTFPALKLGNRYALATRTSELNLDGSLLPMAAGDMKLAVGAEHRNEQLEFSSTVAAKSSLSRNVNALFGELYIPLVGERNAQPAVYQLSLTAALRHEEYDDFGATTNPKAGVVWSPLKGLRLRGSWGTSFRAPYLAQLDSSGAAALMFNAPNSSAPSGFTPVAYLAQAPAPGLGPERATTWTAGFDFQPQVLPGLRVAMTYFDISYEERISAIEGVSIFSAFTSPLLFPRLAMPPNPEILASIAALPPGRFTNRTAVPLLAAQATLEGRLINIASTEISGIDLTIDQELQTAHGNFAFTLNASYLNELLINVASTAPAVNTVDTIFNPADLRLRAGVSWRAGDLSLATFVNYVDDYLDNQTALIKDVCSWATLDFSAAYRFDMRNTVLSGTTLRINMQNVLDKDPPAITDVFGTFGNPGYDTENATPIGRYVSMQITREW